MNANEVFNFMRSGFTPQQIIALESLFNSAQQTQQTQQTQPTQQTQQAQPTQQTQQTQQAQPNDNAMDEYKRAINQIFGIAEPELPPTMGQTGTEVLENMYKNMVGIGGESNVNTANPG